MVDTPVSRSVTIGRSRGDLYAFWRDFSNLARFMENIETVEVSSDRKSHWVVKAPAGQTVEWDAIITDDRPGERIAWQTAEGADVKHAGFVEFKDAPTGRGSEVHAHIVYDAPAGRMGALIAKIFQKEPGVQAHHDLRRLKMLMETGEIATTEPPDAAPRGAAHGKADATDETEAQAARDRETGPPDAAPRAADKVV